MAELAPALDGPTERLSRLRECAALSAAVYHSDRRKFNEVLAANGVSFAEVSRTRTAPFYAVAICPDGDVIVAFMGTDVLNPSDLYTNVQITPRANLLGMVHSGFGQRAASVPVPPFLELLRARKGRKLWITGHSLGGAVAQLFALRLVTESDGDSQFVPEENSQIVHKKISQFVHCLTFGAPLVGDATLHASVRKDYPNLILNIVAVGDIVPRLLCGEISSTAPAREIKGMIARSYKFFASKVAGNHWSPIGSFIEIGIGSSRYVQFPEFAHLFQENIELTNSLQAHKMNSYCRTLQQFYPHWRSRSYEAIPEFRSFNLPEEATISVEVEAIAHNRTMRIGIQGANMLFLESVQVTLMNGDKCAQSKVLQIAPSALLLQKNPTAPELDCSSDQPENLNPKSSINAEPQSSKSSDLRGNLPQTSTDFRTRDTMNSPTNAESELPNAVELDQLVSEHNAQLEFKLDPGVQPYHIKVVLNGKFSVTESELRNRCEFVKISPKLHKLNQMSFFELLQHVYDAALDERSLSVKDCHRLLQQMEKLWGPELAMHMNQGTIFAVPPDIFSTTEASWLGRDKVETFTGPVRPGFKLFDPSCLNSEEKKQPDEYLYARNGAIAYLYALSRSFSAQFYGMQDFLARLPFYRLSGVVIAAAVMVGTTVAPGLVLGATILTLTTGADNYVAAKQAAQLEYKILLVELMRSIGAQVSYFEPYCCEEALQEKLNKLGLLNKVRFTANLTTTEWEALFPVQEKHSWRLITSVQDRKHIIKFMASCLLIFDMRQVLAKRITFAPMGCAGAGKSTLLNRLWGIQVTHGKKLGCSTLQVGIIPRIPGQLHMFNCPHLDGDVGPQRLSVLKAATLDVILFVLPYGRYERGKGESKNAKNVTDF